VTEEFAPLLPEPRDGFGCRCAAPRLRQSGIRVRQKGSTSAPNRLIRVGLLVERADGTVSLNARSVGGDRPSTYRRLGGALANRRRG
jgi:hypothetical protein